MRAEIAAGPANKKHTITAQVQRQEMQGQEGADSKDLIAESIVYTQQENEAIVVSTSDRDPWKLKELRDL